MPENEAAFEITQCWQIYREHCTPVMAMTGVFSSSFISKLGNHLSTVLRLGHPESFLLVRSVGIDHGEWSFGQHGGSERRQGRIIEEGRRDEGLFMSQSARLNWDRFHA